MNNCTWFIICIFDFKKMSSDKQQTTVFFSVLLFSLFSKYSHLQGSKLIICQGSAPFLLKYLELMTMSPVKVKTYFPKFIKEGRKCGSGSLSSVCKQPLKKMRGIKLTRRQWMCLAVWLIVVDKRPVHCSSLEIKISIIWLNIDTNKDTSVWVCDAIIFAIVLNVWSTDP